MYQSLNLPLELSQEITKQNLLKPFQIFVSLKFLYNGQVKLSDIDWQKVSELTGFKDQRTIQTHLKQAKELNWIGTDGTWLFIRSFDRLRKDHQTQGRSAIEISTNDIPNLLELLLGAKIVHRHRAKRYAMKIPTATPTPEPYSDFYDKPKSYGSLKVSCSLIGDWFGFSPSTATRLKQRAKQIGYLDYVHDYVNTGLHKANLPDLSDQIEPTRLFLNNGKICIRLTDQFLITNDHHIYKFATRCSV